MFLWRIVHLFYRTGEFCLCVWLCSVCACPESPSGEERPSSASFGHQIHLPGPLPVLPICPQPGDAAHSRLTQPRLPRQSLKSRFSPSSRSSNCSLLAQGCLIICFCLHVSLSAALSDSCLTHTRTLLTNLQRVRSSLSASLFFYVFVPTNKRCHCWRK